MPDPNWTLIEAPEWLWDGKLNALFRSAGLQVRGEKAGGFRVRTEESYLGKRPDLVTATHLYGAGRPNRLQLLTRMEERASVDLDYVRIQAHLDALAERAARGDGLVHLLNHVQGALALTPTKDLESNAAQILAGLEEVGWQGSDDGSPGPFHSPGLALLGTSTTLQLRLRIPSIFLRIANDPKLAAGSTQHLQDAQSQKNMLFPSSHGLYEGIYMLDPYVGPLRGATSPSIWCLAAPRTFGTLLVLLGRGIAGTRGEPTEPLQTIMIKGPLKGYEAPLHGLDEQSDAVEWWAQALNSLFGVISDPAVFSSKEGVYQASAHLNAMLSLEQLFRRVTSSLVQHRDVTARQALMYTCLDTLEGLTGRNLLTQFEATQAVKCLARIRARMPETAQRVLLPSADRAAAALAQVQQGFTMARDQGQTVLEWAGKTATFERAAASYLVALRNATHGHGGDKGTAEQRERNTTLLIQHNGDIPEDLSLLAYLYLLDLLVDPERLRRILSRSAG